MPSPAEVCDAIMDGLNDYYGYLQSEVIAADNGNLIVALYYADGDHYTLRIEPREGD